MNALFEPGEFSADRMAEEVCKRFPQIAGAVDGWKESWFDSGEEDGPEPPGTYEFLWEVIEPRLLFPALENNDRETIRVLFDIFEGIAVGDREMRNFIEAGLAEDVIKQAQIDEVWPCMGPITRELFIASRHTLREPWLIPK